MISKLNRHKNMADFLYKCRFLCYYDSKINKMKYDKKYSFVLQKLLHVGHRRRKHERAGKNTSLSG